MQPTTNTTSTAQPGGNQNLTQQQQQQQQQQQAFSPLQRLSSLNVNIPAAQAVYTTILTPARFAPLVMSPGGAPQAGRTVYIGNLPPSANVDELLNLVPRRDARGQAVGMRNGMDAPESGSGEKMNELASAFRPRTGMGGVSSSILVSCSWRK
ncbi:hypothetical protein B0H16DRAFT_1462859 [Mycena metata]|uniref:RRM domain-containing protein n=1 Tax=Mycena metata TaxID=1033252 RepID=A0AAD7INI0_9AGAR|nr:hypothetical protein B0H16DRAFT_1462859 [Mycena metata]